MKLLEHLLVALRNFRSYDSLVHPHGELALTGYKSQQAHCPKGLFLCVISLCTRMLWWGWIGTPLRVLVTFITSRSILFSLATLI